MRDFQIVGYDPDGTPILYNAFYTILYTLYQDGRGVFVLSCSVPIRIFSFYPIFRLVEGWRYRNPYAVERIVIRWLLFPLPESCGRDNLLDLNNSAIHNQPHPIACSIRLGAEEVCLSALTITVVIATCNAARTLQRCLDSVNGRAYRNREVVVFDGGSTDGTVEILERNSNLLASGESKPDKGVYDTWSRGRGTCVRGDWICFLGADDYFWSVDVLEKMVPHLEKAYLPRSRVVYGKVAYVNRRGEFLDLIGEPWGRFRESSVRRCLCPTLD